MTRKDPQPFSPSAQYRVDAEMKPALHAVGDSYMLLTRPSPQIPTVELRFQFRYAAAQESRLLSLNPDTLWFEPCASRPSPAQAPRCKVETADVTRVVAAAGSTGFNQLRAAAGPACRLGRPEG